MMFEVIDAQRGRFTESDRAEMPGHFHASLVGGGDRRRGFIGGNEVVDLEIVDALVDPEVDGLGGVLGAGELMHLDRPRTLPFQVWSGDVDLGARHVSRVDGPFKLDIGVRFERRWCGWW